MTGHDHEPKLVHMAIAVGIGIGFGVLLQLRLVADRIAALGAGWRSQPERSPRFGAEQ